MDEIGVFFQPRQTQADPSDPSDPLQTQADLADLADAKLVGLLTCWLVDLLTSGSPDWGTRKYVFKS